MRIRHRLPALDRRLRLRAAGIVIVAGALLPIGCGYDLQLQPTGTATPSAGAALNVHQVPPLAPPAAAAADAQFVPGSSLSAAVPLSAAPIPTLARSVQSNDGAAAAPAALSAAAPAGASAPVAAAAPPSYTNPSAYAVPVEPPTAISLQPASAGSQASPPLVPPAAVAQSRPALAAAASALAPPAAVQADHLAPTDVPARTSGGVSASIAAAAQAGAGQVGTLTPASAPLHVSAPAPTQAPAPDPVATSAPAAAASAPQAVSVQLREGSNDFVYVGQPLPVNRALAALSGMYDSVSFGGVTYRPGVDSPSTLPANTSVHITMKKGQSVNFVMYAQSS